MVTENQLHIVAVTAIILKNNKVLIVRRAASEIAFPNKWTLPGGKVEKGQSILETLRKEIKEETNLEIKNKILYFQDSEFTRPDGYHVIILKFLSFYKKGKVKLSKDLTDFAWIGPEEIEKYDLIGGIKKDLISFFSSHYYKNNLCLKK